MIWLLTGGAGYIGAHVARALVAAGDDVVVVDDLSSGLTERIASLPLVRADLTEGPDPLAAAMTAHGVTGVVHLAAKKSVAESVQRPVHYYEQNVGGTAALLRAAATAGVRHVLYSSTAAVYGESTEELVDETSPTAPSNPYGESKLAAEWLIRSAAAAHGMSWASLRYFNVAGAADSVLADRGRSNLLPIVLRAADREEPVEIFGGDWPTPDGTCIRDYVHVEDLADAHVAMAESLRTGSVRSGVFNVGRGDGVSVLQMLDAVHRVTGRPVRRRVVDRRPGDPARVVADPSAIAAAIGWRAKRDVDDIVGSAWKAYRPGT
ncbi:MAG: UDP-glucose 4-epimerase GalE [Pseudonocardia sp.]|nr:UDP-glucose 4-epimerase GalE [Pseudonocardia sp.]